jgi:hypothetical protein
VDVDRINHETRERVRSLFSQGVSKGMTMDEIADAIESEEFDSVFAASRFELDAPVAYEKPVLSPVVVAMLKAAIDYADRPQLAPIINVAAPNVEAPVIVNNMPQAQAPDVHVNVEAAKADMPMMPDIHVHVPEQAAPIVNVNVPEPRPKRVVYKPDGKVDRVEPY